MNAFDLHNPATLKEAVGLLDPADRQGRVKVLAGGQDLLSEMKEGIAELQAG
jgi:CO/xanthine dehydrogenase FAD-binding subunit